MNWYRERWIFSKKRLLSRRFRFLRGIRNAMEEFFRRRADAKWDKAARELVIKDERFSHFAHEYGELSQPARNKTSLYGQLRMSLVMNGIDLDQPVS